MSISSSRIRTSEGSAPELVSEGWDNVPSGTNIDIIPPEGETWIIERAWNGGRPNISTPSGPRVSGSRTGLYDGSVFMAIAQSAGGLTSYYDGWGWLDNREYAITSKRWLRIRFDNNEDGGYHGRKV